MTTREIYARRILDRIVLTETGCAEVTQSLDRAGYGTIGAFGRSTSTHRLAYELWVGPIPAGLQLDHLCRNRACCNPAHLEPVTPWENNIRRPALNRDFCPAGHPREGHTKILRPAGRPSKRACQTCNNAGDAARRVRRRAERGLPPKRYYTDAEVAQWRAARLAGETYKAIASRYGADRTTVSRVLRGVRRPDLYNEEQR